MNVPDAKPLIARIQQAAQQLRNGRRAEALTIYEEVSRRAARHVAVHVQLGHFCSELGAFDQAIEHYAIAVDQEPDNAHYLACLGFAHQQNGEAEQALGLYERAMAIDAEIPSVLNGLGAIYIARKDFARARTYLEPAERLKPGDASVRTNYAISLVNLNEHEQALKHAHKALKLDPLNLNAHYVVGQILTETGRTEEAVRHFEKTIRQHRTFGAVYDLLARMRVFTEADRPFIESTEKLLKAGMPAEQRYSVHYALGKMYDDCREWDKAFEHYRQANVLQKKIYDTDREKKLFKQMKKAFDAAALEKYRAFGAPSEQPVFIVGMPRSGTTLMERIIASHPRAAGGDELLEIPRIAKLISPGDDMRRFVSATHANLTPENIESHAESYLSVLRQGREGADRIVDKLPGNLFHLGLISILFPNATIIHAVRHPLDTCLSCYFQNFTNVRWANDFEVIAEIYGLYREIMAYWQRVLPDGKILEVHYERLIDNPETEGRRMLEACGLDWDSSALRFYEQESVVKTASMWQVRQPIYRSSKMRWKSYAPYLGELANALSEYLQEDREELRQHGIDLAARSGVGWMKRLIG